MGEVARVRTGKSRESVAIGRILRGVDCIGWWRFMLRWMVEEVGIGRFLNRGEECFG